MKKIYFITLLALTALAAACSSDSDTSSPSGDGTGGSTAIFVLNGNYLYTVDNTTLNVFSLLDATSPVKVNDVQIGADIETLFTDGTYLYVGSQNGMFMYSLESPENPEMLSAVQHFNACDPVVSDGQYAYVTLHSNTWCGNNINALQVYDVSNPAAPVLIHSRTLSKPKGLGLYGHYLIVCDDELKIFDVTNPVEPILAHSIDKSCNDVIISGNTLFAIGSNAVYNYTLNPATITSTSLNSEVDF